MDQQLDDTTATQTYAALKYWSRATRYEPTDDERRCVAGCEERATTYARLAAAVGTAGSLGFASALRLTAAPKLGVTAAGLFVGTVYGHFKSNAPCLRDLLALNKADDSKLARQAQRILDAGPRRAFEEMAHQYELSQKGVAVGDAGLSLGRPADDAHTVFDWRPNARDGGEPELVPEPEPEPLASALGGGAIGTPFAPRAQPVQPYEPAPFGEPVAGWAPREMSEPPQYAAGAARLSPGPFSDAGHAREDRGAEHLDWSDEGRRGVPAEWAEDDRHGGGERAAWERPHYGRGDAEWAEPSFGGGGGGSPLGAEERWAASAGVSQDGGGGASSWDGVREAYQRRRMSEDGASGRSGGAGGLGR